MLLLKIGGGKSINIDGIVRDILSLNRKVVILHGANQFRDDLAEKIGYEKKIVTSVAGVSSVYSDEKLIDLMMMTYSGLRNKRIVEKLQKSGINAIGLSGLDGGIFRAKRNRGVRIFEDGKKKIMRDFSGKVKKVDRDLLLMLLENGYTPVLTVPVLDENGNAINSENDDILVELSKELNPDGIISLIEAPGILRDPQVEKSLIPSLNLKELNNLTKQSSGRIQRKLIALQKLSKITSGTLIVADGRVSSPIKFALEGRGTSIISNSN